jgi:hypothetical protein
MPRSSQPRRINLVDMSTSPRCPTAASAAGLTETLSSFHLRFTRFTLAHSTYLTACPHPRLTSQIIPELRSTTVNSRVPSGENSITLTQASPGSSARICSPVSMSYGRIVRPDPQQGSRRQGWFGDVCLWRFSQVFHGRIVHDRRLGLCGRRHQSDDHHDAHETRD